MEPPSVDDVIEIQQLLARYAVGMTKDDIDAPNRFFGNFLRHSDHPLGQSQVHVIVKRESVSSWLDKAGNYCADQFGTLEADVYPLGHISRKAARIFACGIKRGKEVLVSIQARHATSHTPTHEVILELCKEFVGNF